MRGIANCLAVALALSACGGGADESIAEPDYVKAHDIRQLMIVVVEPQANVYWDSAGLIIDATGEHDLAPTTDEGWFATRSAAATIAEIGNLLMTPQYAEGRSQDWMQFSRSLVEVGLKAEAAAADRDADAVLQVGGIMYNVCRACHQVYLPSAD